MEVKGSSIDNSGNLQGGSSRIGEAQLNVPRSKIETTIQYVQEVKNRTPEMVNPEQLKKIIDEIAPRLQEIGIFLSFDKIGNMPIVKVKDETGKVIKVFPKEEIAELMKRIKIFFDVLTELLLSVKA